MYLFKDILSVVKNNYTSVSGRTVYPSYKMTKWLAVQLIFNETEEYQLFPTSGSVCGVMMYNQQQNQCTSTFITAVKFKWSAVWRIFGAIKTEGHHPRFIHHYLALAPAATGWKAGIHPQRVTSPLKSTHAIHSHNYLESLIESRKNAPFWTVGGDQISEKLQHFWAPSLTFE